MFLDMKFTKILLTLLLEVSFFARCINTHNHQNQEEIGSSEIFFLLRTLLKPSSIQILHLLSRSSQSVSSSSFHHMCSLQRMMSQRSEFGMKSKTVGLLTILKALNSIELRENLSSQQESSDQSLIFNQR